MSDMIINDSVPVDMKWGELIRYNIFIMKLVEFIVSVLLMIIPYVLKRQAVSHCLAVSPAVVFSTIIIVLYLVDQVQDYAEQLYLTIQILLTSIELIVVLIQHDTIGSIYALFYFHFIVIMCIDLYFLIKERGYALFRQD